MPGLASVVKKKRVIVHFGFHKTGSSALQTFFSANAAALQRAGVAYPYPEPESVISMGSCSGNLVQILFRDGYVNRTLAANARGTKPANAHVRAATEEFFQRLAALVAASDCDRVLFSGELVGVFSPEQFRMFEENFVRPTDAKLVGFVRDPFDFCYSAWKQHIKMGMSVFPFEEWLTRAISRKTGLSMLEGFARMREAGLDLVLLNFDTFRRDIVGAFFSAAGLTDLGELPYSLSGERYNRSLTTSEAALLQKVNRAFPKSSFPLTVARMLLRRSSSQSESPGYYSREAHQRILDSFGEQIEAINARIIGDPISSEIRDAPSTEPRIPDEDLEVLFEALKTVLTGKGAGPMARRPDLPVHTDQKSVPPDFDPEAYLFHNEDVAIAKVDPYTHYVTNGQFEGRHYKYF